MGLMDQFNKLTNEEKAVLALLAAKDANVISIISSSKDIAFNETTKRFGYNGHNDKTDAFRHCFWSAILARDLGYFEAKAFTTAHEASPTNPPAEKEMDLHNNGVGLKIGFYYWQKDSNETLSDKCMKALKNGELKIIKP